jgi:hypothetical protein
MISRINSVTNFGSIYLSDKGRANINEIKASLVNRRIITKENSNDDIFITVPKNYEDEQIDADKKILNIVKKLDSDAFIVPDYIEFPYSGLDDLTVKGINAAIKEGYFERNKLQRELREKHWQGLFTESGFNKLLEAGIVEEEDFERLCSDDLIMNTNTNIEPVRVSRIVSNGNRTLAKNFYFIFENSGNG